MRAFIAFLRAASAALGLILALVAWQTGDTGNTSSAVIGAIMASPFLLFAFWPRRTHPQRDSTSRSETIAFTYEYERFAADNQRVVLITYRDKGGNQSEREIEVYCPQDDNYVYGYCRLRKEPRTFLVTGILSWEISPERYTYNPLIEEWFATEGKKFGDEREDWQEWVQLKRITGTSKPYILKTPRTPTPARAIKKKPRPLYRNEPGG